MSEKKQKAWKKGLFFAVFLALCVTGITFLILSMTQGEPRAEKLIVGMGCIACANIMNLIHLRRGRKRNLS